MNYYPFHLGDYAAHTAHLDLLEDLAYRRMLDLYYRTEKPLPDAVEDIGRLIRMREHLAAIRDVLNEFFQRTDEGWFHVRCDAEITKMQDKQAKAKASAAASVKARSTNAQRTLNERLTDVELPTPTPTPTPSSVTDVTGGGAAKPADEMTKDELWTAGKSLLSAVMPKAQCGSFVGKLVKDYGDAVVVEAVRAAVVTRPADPIEYLKATCQRAAGQRQTVNKQEALEQRNRQVAAQWAAEGA